MVEVIIDPTAKKTKTVENNCDKALLSFFFSDMYFTTPLKTPKDDVLVIISVRFRTCPIFAIPASPTVTAKNRCTNTDTISLIVITTAFKDVILRTVLFFIKSLIFNRLILIYDIYNTANLVIIHYRTYWNTYHGFMYRLRKW